MLDHITPVLLTFNEERNIARTLACLKWAKDIVVVDSGSTDGTRTAVAKFSNVRVFNRRFDNHANQWRFATEETQIATSWILRLDADYHIRERHSADRSDSCQRHCHSGDGAGDGGKPGRGHFQCADFHDQHWGASGQHHLEFQWTDPGSCWAGRDGAESGWADGRDLHGDT